MEHVAQLSKLSINESEVQTYTEQLTKILKFVEELSSVDTNNVEPLITASDIDPTTRADEVRSGLTAEALLANAPARVGNLYKVPPVV